MARFILLVASLFPLAFVQAATCDFFGDASFEGMTAGAAVPTFERLEFRHLSSSVITIRYVSGVPAGGHETPYVVDGLPHPGNGSFSGDSYTALCDTDRLTVTVTDRHASGPLVYDFRLGGPGASILSMEERFGGHVRVSTYARKF